MTLDRLSDRQTAIAVMFLDFAVVDAVVVLAVVLAKLAAMKRPTNVYTS